MVVQPWGRVLVPTQKICITISLNSSAEWGSPPRWRMVTSGWAQDSWTTIASPPTNQNKCCLLFWGPVMTILLGLLFGLFHLWQGPTVSSSVQSLSPVRLLERFKLNCCFYKVSAGFRHRIPLLRSGKERLLLCEAGLRPCTAGKCYRRKRPLPRFPRSILSMKSLCGELLGEAHWLKPPALAWLPSSRLHEFDDRRSR